MNKFKLNMQDFVRKMLTIISPTLNTKVCYYIKFHKKLDLKNPKTLNEKNLWLKLNRYRNNSLVKQCSDKYLVRNYIKDCGCEEILNPLINIYESANQIDWDNLPNSFAIKWNYGCGLNVIVKNKEELDISSTIKKIRKMGRKNFYLPYSEFQYKNVKKFILVEKYLNDGTGYLPTDYKIYCFNGKPYCVMIVVGREVNDTKYYFFSRKWEFLRINKSGLNAPEGFNIDKPNGVDEMFDYAEILSKPFEFVRVDFYLINGKPIFGELTFTPSGALDSDRLPSTDLLFGELLDLRKDI